MNKLILIAMVSLGVVACTKENNIAKIQSNASDGTIRPLIGNVEYELMDIYPNENMLPFTQNSLNIYEVPNHATWRELTDNAEDLLPSYGVDFNTSRVLIVCEALQPDIDGDFYSPRIVSMIGNDNNIVVNIQGTILHGNVAVPPVARFPGWVIKIPRTNQSVALNILPDVHEDVPNYDE